MTHYRARIIGTGSYLPERRLGNKELAERMDTSDEWIFSRTGIRERRIAAAGQYTSDLATQAAQQALAAASMMSNDIDMILVATSTPDLIFPATATQVQYKLGSHSSRAPAFDIQAVCTGFIYALSV
ncbi:MAG: 3-oxoacyl-ACP synthase, partial [Magnetococcales bacterium]|nr:3-oxoacyl-ACP synthase [Magnetococcales bacterium]